MNELADNGVEIYRFPVDDETVAEVNSQMNVRNAICDQNKTSKGFCNDFIFI